MRLAARSWYTGATSSTAMEPGRWSARTAGLIQLSAALDDAMKQGMVARNVARLVKRPDVEDAEMEFWTQTQSRAFREHVREHRLYALFLLSLCGLRRSEIMGCGGLASKNAPCTSAGAGWPWARTWRRTTRSRGGPAAACRFRPTW
ncbi:hypothetical protein [Nocardia sp. R6R-6]|uniref:hypothetical protein n=1 Tax=Nocardia sp. R6R-6 TaxID=3459303 RepID=UPI00403DDE26